jgi:hypothetical protein
MDHLSKLEESALAKFGHGDFNGAISDLSKVRLANVLCACLLTQVLQAIFNRPDLPELFVLRGRAYAALHDVKSAISNLTQALLPIPYIQRPLLTIPRSGDCPF